VEVAAERSLFELLVDDRAFHDSSGVQPTSDGRAVARQIDALQLVD
jgi:hypothetical protein